jgi:hypothetical protein
MEDPVGSQQKSFDGPVNFYRFNGILRTGRNMAAGGRGQRRYGCAVKINRQQQHLNKYPSDPSDDFFNHCALGEADYTSIT